MEEARYWMWTKRNETSLSSQVLASTTKSTKYGDSWEEQAFAEDSAGHLGGCIWPPRSYTCSFCRREFRSAQALGGHMNVHRRDRARLKQSPSPINNHLSNPSTSLAIHQHPSLVYTKDSDDQEVLRSPSSRVLAPIMQVRFKEKSLLASSFSSPIFQEQQKKTSILTPLLWSDFVADRYSSNFSDLEKEEKIFNLLESQCSMKRDYVEADLSVSLNSIVSGNDKQPASLGEEEDTKSYKRRRTDDETVLFFPARNSVDKNISFPGSELVLEVSPILKEDLDLELRLGA